MQACEAVKSTFEDDSTHLWHHCADYICYPDAPETSPADCQLKCPEYYACLVEYHKRHFTTTATFISQAVHGQVNINDTYHETVAFNHMDLYIGVLVGVFILITSLSLVLFYALWKNDHRACSRGGNCKLGNVRSCLQRFSDESVNQEDMPSQGLTIEERTTEQTSFITGPSSDITSSSDKRQTEVKQSPKRASRMLFHISQEDAMLSVNTHKSQSMASATVEPIPHLDNIAEGYPAPLHRAGARPRTFLPRSNFDNSDLVCPSLSDQRQLASKRSIYSLSKRPSYTRSISLEGPTSMKRSVHSIKPQSSYRSMPYGPMGLQVDRYPSVEALEPGSHPYYDQPVSAPDYSRYLMEETDVKKPFKFEPLSDNSLLPPIRDSQLLHSYVSIATQTDRAPRSLEAAIQTEPSLGKNIGGGDALREPRLSGDYNATNDAYSLIDNSTMSTDRIRSPIQESDGTPSILPPSMSLTSQPSSRDNVDYHLNQRNVVSVNASQLNCEESTEPHEKSMPHSGSYPYHLGGTLQVIDHYLSNPMEFGIDMSPHSSAPTSQREDEPQLANMSTSGAVLPSRSESISGFGSRSGSEANGSQDTAVISGSYDAEHGTAYIHLSSGDNNSSDETTRPLMNETEPKSSV